VDFPLLEASAWRQLAASSEDRALLGRGYRVLHDELGLETALRESQPPPDAWPPDVAALTELAGDFWYHALWTAKKLRRGEVFTAIDCLSGYLKSRLVRLLEWHARSLDPSVDTWPGGRFLERWGDPGALIALEDAYALYSVRDVARGLWASIDLWEGLERETAARLGLDLELDHGDLRRRIAEVVPDPRR
jgi:aminoglycoside 6-adenylyltransferase